MPPCEMSCYPSLEDGRRESWYILWDAAAGRKGNSERKERRAAKEDAWVSRCDDLEVVLSLFQLINCSEAREFASHNSGRTRRSSLRPIASSILPPVLDADSHKGAASDFASRTATHELCILVL